MKTPQNLPALITEMQERAQDEWKCTCDDCGHINDIYNMDDLTDLIADTANATLEYVKGVAEGMKGASANIMIPSEGPIEHALREGYNLALEDLIARLTSNHQ